MGEKFWVWFISDPSYVSIDRNFRVNENFEELPLVAYNFIQEDKIRQLKIVNLPTKVDPKIKLTASREKFKVTIKVHLR